MEQAEMEERRRLIWLGIRAIEVQLRNIEERAGRERHRVSLIDRYEGKMRTFQELRQKKRRTREEKRTNKKERDKIRKDMERYIRENEEIKEKSSHQPSQPNRRGSKCHRKRLHRTGHERKKKKKKKTQQL